MGFAWHSQAQNQETEPNFRLPDVPDALTAPEERAAYLALHYWDHFNFGDTSLITMPEITEQAFVDFISILPYTEKAASAVDTLIRRASVEKEMLKHFISLSDKYLYEPLSPIHDEDMLILFLRAQLANPAVDEAERAPCRYRLEMALKNRPGDIASDFVVRCRDHRQRKLSKIEADLLLLYFYDPDCETCRRVKEQLSASSVINGTMDSGQLRLFSVCIEGKTPAWDNASFPARWIDGCDEKLRIIREQLYDFKMMPTLYLLDREKRVILKETSVEQIEEWLRK
ncbi:MAG: DUF5106 domain-containing protein [Dysgonamonadaceae bacterium]|nr:DUF5106 domain-containing protein [Dysgonamonadaceae bacterium]